MFRLILIFFALCIIITENLSAKQSQPEKNTQKKIAPKLELPITCPKDWEIIQDRSQLPKKIAVMFVGSKKGNFAPSINLATEATNASIEEYLNEAEQYHKAIAGTIVTRLGKLTSKAGELELIQIDRATTWGEVRFIQGAFMHQKRAYVITATCLADDFPQLSKTIFSTLQSFHLPLKEKTNTEQS